MSRVDLGWTRYVRCRYMQSRLLKNVNSLHLLHSFWLKKDCAISACLPLSTRRAGRLKHCYRACLQTSRLRMQTASTSCRVLELVAQHGWVPEEQIKLLNNSLSRIEILTRYVSAVDDNADSAVDDNADSATGHCWHDGFWIDSDGHWHPTDSPDFGDAGYWSDWYLSD